MPMATWHEIAAPPNPEPHNHGLFLKSKRRPNLCSVNVSCVLARSNLPLKRLKVI